jgi:hypothetical protein
MTQDCIFIYPKAIEYVPSRTKLTRWYMCIPMPNGRRKHVALSAKEANEDSLLPMPCRKVSEREHERLCGGRPKCDTDGGGQ